MNRWRMTLATLTLLSAALLASCGGASAPPSAERPTAPQSAGGQAIELAKSAELALKQLDEQHALFVTVGATVSWKNDDAALHTIEAEDGAFKSEIPPGKTFAWRAGKPGIYRYSCDLPACEGVLIASEPAAAAKYYGGSAVAKYFTDTCGGCHGPNREGGTGPALIPGRLTSPDQLYFDTIKNGRPNTIMPAWGKAGLSDAEIWGLIGMIRSQPNAAAVEWGMEQIKGSLRALVDEATLPSAPQHKGNLGNLMLVTEREARSIAVIDGDSDTLLGHIPASYRAHGYAFDPTSDRWAYNMGRDGWVFKIDLYTLKPVRTVRVGQDSRALAISDDGKYLIAGNYIPNSAVIMDARTLEPLKVIETAGNDPDGKFVQSRVCIISDVSAELVGPYFLVALKEAGQVWRIDYSKPDFPIAKIENVGRILHDGFLSPDNRFFYLASQKDNWMAVIDVAQAKLVGKISTGKTPHPGSGAVWQADGTIYGATTHAAEGKVTIWDLKTNQIVGTVKTPGPGLFIRASEHSPYVWADAVFGAPPNTVTVFKKEKPFEVVKVIQQGKRLVHPEFTDEGDKTYVADWDGNQVLVYDARSLEKIAEIGGVSSPSGIFNTERRLELLGH